MYVENYRFVIIGSIVTALLLYFISFNVIIFLYLVLLALYLIWSYRNELGLQRRLLHSGLWLSLTHKSKRVSNRTSNLNAKGGTTSSTKQSANVLRKDVNNESILSRRNECRNPSGYDFSKSLVPSGSFTSPRSFVFGSPRTYRNIVYLGKQSENLLSDTTSNNFRPRKPPLPQENENLNEEDHEQGVPGYIFQPTRRLLSVNRRYPTHQARYGNLGSFPSIHLSPSPVPVFNTKPPIGHHTPVTIRIAPPRVFTPSPIKLSYSSSPALLKAVEDPDPCDPRTVVAALKENSRKRQRREDADCDPKRQRCDSSSNNSTVSSRSELERLHPMEQGGEEETSQELVGKRPATPGPLAEAFSNVSQKRHKNNAIFSSYSSTKRTAKQMSEISPPSNKQVKISSPSIDRFSQTDSAWLLDMAKPLTSTSSKVSSANPDTPSVEKGPSDSVISTPVPKSPFPALKEGYSPRQNISFYADIGKTNKTTYNIPEYFPTLADFKHDKQIERQRLNHLLYGSKSPVQSTPSDISASPSTASTKFVTFATDKPAATVLTASDTSSPDSTSVEPPQLKIPVCSVSTAMITPISSNIISVNNDTSTSKASLNADSSPKPFLPGAGFFSSAMPISSSLTPAATSAPFVSPTSLSFPTFSPQGQGINTNSGSETMSTVASTTVDKAFFKFPASPVPLSVPSLTTTSPTTVSLDSAVKQQTNTSFDNGSVTTLTTATTTQTSILTSSLFTSTPPPPKPISDFSSVQPSTAVSTSVTSSTPSIFSSITTTTSSLPPYSLATSLSQTSSNSSIFTAGSQIATVAKTSSESPVSTTLDTASKPVGLFAASFQPNPASSQPQINFGSATASQPESSLKPTSVFASAAPTVSTFGNAIVSSNTFTVPATTNSIFSTISQPFGVNSPARSGFGTSTPSSNVFATSTPVTSSVGGTAPSIFGSTTLSNNDFGTTTPLSSTFGTTPASGVFGITSSATPSTSAFGVTSPQSIVFGGSSLPASSTMLTNSTFGATTQASSIFGSSSETKNTFTTSSQPQLAFGASTQQNTGFAFNKPSIFSTSTTTSGPTQPAATTAAMFTPSSQPSSNMFNAPAAVNNFSQFTPASSTFGAAAPVTNVFGQSSTPNAFSSSGMFGSATSQPVNSFGTAPQPVNSFGTAPQPVNSFGTAPQPKNMFGAVTQASSPFGSAPDSKPTFAPANPSAFGNQSLKFSSPFGNSAGTGLGTFSNPAGLQGGSTFNNPAGLQGSSFDASKPGNVVSPSASAFGNPAPATSETSTFNMTPSTNFNFSPRPNFNFGSTAETPNFGSTAPSQPFVFTGGQTPTGAMASQNSFFSIGSGSRERNKLAPRKRFTRK